MPVTLEDGSERMTPEETVAAMIEQGYTPEQIVSEAEENIAVAEAGIVWVNAEASNQSAATDMALAVQTREREALNAAEAGGANTDEIKKARAAVDDAATATLIFGRMSGQAKDAAQQHRAHATETITNAQRRIAAANDPELVKPALARWVEIEKANKANEKAEAARAKSAA
jgi:hypothetical protein